MDTPPHDLFDPFTSQIIDYLHEVLPPAERSNGVCPIHPCTAATYFPFTRASPAPPLPSCRDAERSPSRTVISVENVDCVDAALAFSEKGFEPRRMLILNMANEWNVGGGFERTGGSQEEYLFRRTSLAASLWPRRRAKDERWRTGSMLLGRAANGEEFYPLSECGVVLSPNVDVIADSSLIFCPAPLRAAKSAAFPSGIGVITVAAQDLRPRHYNHGAVFEEKLTREKIRSLLYVAASNNYTLLVLGALGCGAFNNPPDRVAALFRELLVGEFSGAFHNVTFAVAKSARNFSAFAAVFGDLLTPALSK